MAVELKETETAHRDALSEMEKMKATMEQMELERADMVAEIEAQIESALQGMNFRAEVSLQTNVFILLSSRPSSRASVTLPATLTQPPAQIADFPVSQDHGRGGPAMLQRPGT